MLKFKECFKGIVRHGMAAVTVLMLAPACINDHYRLIAGGSEINFNAITETELPETRTVFSGSQIGGKERIDWAEGDRITIFMTNSEGTASHDYAVGEIEQDGIRSNGKVAAEGGSGLKWAESGQHEFAAWYPTVEVFGADEIYRPAEGSSTNGVTVGESVDLASAQLVIPAFRKDTLYGNVFKPDMRYAWMLAQTTAEAKAETVDLNFVPAYIAFHITLKAGERSLAVNQVRVCSDSRDLAGQFTLDKTTMKATAKALGTGATRYSAVKTENTDGTECVVGAGNSLEVTILTVPDEFEDCSIQVIGDFKGDGTLVTRQLTLRDGSGNNIRILPGRKYNITVMLPQMAEIDGGEDYIDWTPTPITPLGYEFSVSDTRKVRFTTANLAYMGATGGDKPWRIMKYPWSLIEGTDGSNTFAPGGNIDFALFGWATSGYQGKSPWMTSATSTDYGPATDGLWTADSDLWDWGVYNTIYDCSALSAVPNLRTLSFAEWDHLLNYRSDTYRFQCATVNATKGLIVFPDGFTPASCPELVQSITPSLCNGPQDFSQVSYSTSQFYKLSNLGAVFLPVTGARNGTNLLPGHGRFYGQPEGFYWTSTGVIEHGSSYGAFCLVFDYKDIAPYEGDDYYPRGCGAAVRLVQDIPSIGVLTPANKSFTVGADGRKVQFTTSNLMYAGTSDPDPATGLGKLKLMAKPWAIIEDNNVNGATSANQDADQFGWATSGYHGKTPWMYSTDGSDYGPAIADGSWTSDSDLWDWGQYNTVYASDGETVLSGLRSLTSEEWLYLLEGRNQNHSYTPVTVQRNGSDYLFGLLIAYDGADVSNLPVSYPDGVGHLNSWFPASAGGSLSPGPGSSSSTSSISRNLAPSLHFTCEQIDILVADGYLFLPTTVSCHGYWTSSAGSSIAAESLDLPYSVVSITVPQSRPRYDKCHVRLVKEIVD